jgi:hypothetical protein
MANTNWTDNIICIKAPCGNIGNTYLPPASSNCLDKNGNKRSCQELQNETLQKAKEEIQKQSLQGNNTKEPIYYIAVTTGVLIAGYLIWKKFKK